MPQGQAAVNWTAEEDAKLFLTVLAVQGIQVNYAAVAKAFGPHVPGSCIQSRMKALRKKAASLEITLQENPVTGSKRAHIPASGTPSKKAKINSKTMEIGGTLSPDVTPPATSETSPSIGRVRKINTPKSLFEKSTTLRASPRKNTKKDYKAVSDPFVSMENATDSNGENVFGNENSESEDSHDNNEFKGEAIKTEEESAI